MREIEKYNLTVILGPTASGKTSIAVRLAAEMRSEIISADSRQVYRGMDIGTGKDLSEYDINGKVIPYHLIDIVDPGHEFSVFEYQKRFFEAFEEIRSRSVIPIMAGGTGLYIESVLKGYRMVEVPEDQALRREMESRKTEDLVELLKGLNPRLHNTTDLKNRDRLIRAIEIALYSQGNELKPSQNPRGLSLFTDEAERSRRIGTVPLGTLPEIRPLIIGIRWDRKLLRERITSRLRKRLEAGLIEEVEHLHASGLSWEKLDFFGLEYRYVGLYLQRKLNRNDMFQKLNSAIHRFAKRQETWFRRMERKGIKINWIDNADYGRLRNFVYSELSL